MNSASKVLSKIVVIEDDNDIRTTLSQILLLEGFEVRCAANGREGLVALEEFRPDLVLLDLMMPVMNGYDFRKKQRENPAIAGIPVVVLSADVHATQKAVDAGFRAILRKPVELDQLLEVIRLQLES